MPSAPVPELTDWWKVAGPTIGIALLAAIVWLKSFVEGKKEGPVPAGEAAGKGVAGGYLEQALANAVTAIADDVHELRDIAERRERAESQERVAELVELRRLLAQRGRPPAD